MLLSSEASTKVSGASIPFRYVRCGRRAALSQRCAGVVGQIDIRRQAADVDCRQVRRHLIGLVDGQADGGIDVQRRGVVQAEPDFIEVPAPGAAGAVPP